MDTEIAITNSGGTFWVSQAEVELAQRRAELNTLTLEAPVMAELWAQMADDFAGLGYTINAAICRRKAEHYGGGEKG
jgi:hypothetical protein